MTQEPCSLSALFSSGRRRLGLQATNRLGVAHLESLGLCRSEMAWLSLACWPENDGNVKITGDNTISSIAARIF